MTEPVSAWEVQATLEAAEDGHGASSGMTRRLVAEVNRLRARVDELEREPMHPAHLYREHNKKLIAQLDEARGLLQGFCNDPNNSRDMRALTKVFLAAGKPTTESHATGRPQNKSDAAPDTKHQA